MKVPGGTQSWHIPFDAVGGTKNPPPESKQNITPEQLSRGAIVQFEAEQPEVMAQAAAKAAGPMAPKEYQPIRPTKYSLDDFAVGQHVTGKAGVGEADTYHGTVVAAHEKGMAAGLIKIKLDAPTAQGISKVALYPTRSPRSTSRSPRNHRKQTNQKNRVLHYLLQATASKIQAKVQASPRVRRGMWSR